MNASWRDHNFRKWSHVKDVSLVTELVTQTYAKLVSNYNVATSNVT